MGQGSSCSHDISSTQINSAATGSAISKRHWPLTVGESNEEPAADLTVGLPDECLAWVFNKLSCQDRNSCSLVCKRWRLVDSKSRQRLTLLARSDISPLVSTLLSRFSSVSILSLKCSRKFVSIDNDGLSRIPTLLSSLKKLKLKGCVDVSDDGLHAFSLHRPPLLTKLSFASCGFGARGIMSLVSNCPSLQDLTLKRLRKLDAQNIPLSLEDAEIKHNQLERICLKDLHNARLFIPLLCASSKALQTLIVCRSSGNWDRVFESFQQASGISSLSEIQMENVQIGDLGLVAVSASCPNLQVLYLSRVSDCTDEGLSAVANSCRKLRKLHIDAWTRFGNRTIGDNGVLSVATRCSSLQEVVLMGVPVSVASLNALASNCPALERMALCNTDSIRDSELAFIAAKFLPLKKLCIKNCPISDSGIEAVGEGCPSLEKLKVKRCRGVSQVSASQLRMQRSSLVVSVDSAFEGEGVMVEEDEVVTANGAQGSNGRRRAPSNNRSTSTHVICSSRGALLLRSRFGNAMQLSRRRPNDNTPVASASRTTPIRSSSVE
ncbi:hypothetical protein L1049_001359 [Liquidambar formosana]|uniref:F-box domain-containing protein n=1 Tax=Liquidambar formosana TaxID=63359 RepID=A0AAP0NAG5_LIQFO